MFGPIKNILKILVIFVVPFIFSVAVWWLLDPVTVWQRLTTFFVSIVVVCLLTIGIYKLFSYEW